LFWAATANFCGDASAIDAKNTAQPNNDNLKRAILRLRLSRVDALVGQFHQEISALWPLM
jgi:hypothetical protein